MPPADEVPVPPLARKSFDAAYEALRQVGVLAQKGVFATTSTPRELVKRVWDGWQVVASGQVCGGLEDAYVLRRGEEWVCATVRVAGRQVNAGAAAVSGRWEELTASERRWRFDESVRHAVTGQSFEDLLSGLCARIRPEVRDEQVEAELVALAMTADHGHAPGPLRFFLRLQRVLPQVDLAAMKARRAKL